MNNIPSNEAQQELMDIDHGGKTKVSVPFTKKVYKIGYLKPYTTEKVTSVMLKGDAGLPDEASEEEFMKLMSKKSKVLAKIASIIILNNFFKIKLFHAIHWRWLHYVKQYDYGQLMPIIMEGKKKIPVIPYAMSMGLSVTMMETMKNLTKKEAKQFHLELMQAQEALSEKSTLGQ